MTETNQVPDEAYLTVGDLALLWLQVPHWYSEESKAAHYGQLINDAAAGKSYWIGHSQGLIDGLEINDNQVVEQQQQFEELKRKYAELHIRWQRVTADLDAANQNQS